MLPKNEIIYIGRKKSRKKCKSGWDRSLNTSKYEQDISTPKIPPLSHTMHKQKENCKVFTLGEMMNRLKKRD